MIITLNAIIIIIITIMISLGRLVDQPVAVVAVGRVLPGQNMWISNVVVK